MAEREERLYPSLTVTGDISSLGNLHEKKVLQRGKRKTERNAERQKSHIWD
jgi:hypothetical protein